MKTYNFVYKITFNNGLYYFGQHKTDNLDDNYLGSSKLVQELINNNPGLEYKREILVYCKTQEELNKWERYYIKQFYTTDYKCLNRSCCTCITNYKKNNKPMLGKHHTEETKRKISESNKGRKMSEEFKQKMAIISKDKRPMLGRHHTEESKNKISESNKGKHSGKSPANKGKSRIYDSNGKYHYE